MLRLVVTSVLGLCALSSGSSPCQDRYSEWVSDPSVFTRDDQPKHLQGLHIACVWRATSGEPLRVEAYKNAVDEGSPLQVTASVAIRRIWSSEQIAEQLSEIMFQRCN